MENESLEDIEHNIIQLRNGIKDTQDFEIFIPSYFNDEEEKIQETWESIDNFTRIWNITSRNEWWQQSFELGNAFIKAYFNSMQDFENNLEKLMLEIGKLKILIEQSRKAKGSVDVESRQKDIVLNKLLERINNIGLGGNGRETKQASTETEKPLSSNEYELPKIPMTKEQVQTAMREIADDEAKKTMKKESYDIPKEFKEEVEVLEEKEEQEEENKTEALEFEQKKEEKLKKLREPKINKKGTPYPSYDENEEKDDSKENQ